MAKREVLTRQCIGCRAKKPKEELLRFARTPDGRIALDIRQKGDGRGAYLCPNPACLSLAKKHKALEGALKIPVPPALYEEAEKEMQTFAKR